MPTYSVEVVVETVLHKHIEAADEFEAVKIAKGTAHRGITWAEPSEQSWEAGEMLELDDERIIVEEISPERMEWRGLA